MSKTVTCDHCGRTIDASGTSELADWIALGWRDAGTSDACSFPCARALIDALEEQAERIDAELAAEGNG